MASPYLEQSDPPTLSRQMRCGMFSNGRGEIMLVHDQEIPQSVEWVEYDKMTGKISLIHEDGSLRYLGIDLDSRTKSNLRHGINIIMSLIQNSKIIKSNRVSLVVQDY